jgi:hypothetical protein
MSNGKGDKNRSYTPAYRDNYDSIFKSKKPQPIVDLKDERIKQLEEALAHANQRIRILTDMTEDVCCGTRLDCPKCKQLMPCMCGHEK